MKIFLDCGAHDGCSVTKFRKLYDKKQKYKIYSFEPEPQFAKFFIDTPKHTFINKAVWISDGFLDYYRSNEKLRVGSTLIKEKKSGKIDKQHPIKVETIDFSKWILENLNEDDYIILKMDIEGAEYKVLPKMFEDGSFAYINELWIEWHYRKIRLDENQHNKVFNQIHIPITKWDALEFCSFRKRNRRKDGK